MESLNFTRKKALKKKALVNKLNEVDWNVLFIDEKGMIVNKKLTEQDILKITIPEVEHILKCDKSNFVTCKHLESTGYIIKICSPSISSTNKILRGKKGQGIYNYTASIMCMRPVFGTAAFMRKDLPLTIPDLFIMVKNTISFLQDDPKRMKLIPLNTSYRAFLKSAFVTESNRTSIPSFNIMGTEDKTKSVDTSKGSDVTGELKESKGHDGTNILNESKNNQLLESDPSQKDFIFDDKIIHRDAEKIFEINNSDMGTLDVGTL